MIGFVVLFALFIWVIVTIFSMMLFHKICRKIFPNYRWSGIVGVFIGFMLLMGGWFVYWGIEYIQVRSYLNEMCKQSGIKIYITPEEWKEKIGGEEAWRNIRIIDKSPPDNIKDETIVFEGDKYSISWQYNELVYSYKINRDIQHVHVTDYIYYDRANKIALFKYRDVSISAGNVVNILGGFKFWIDNIDGCSDVNSLIKTNSSFFNI